MSQCAAAHNEPGPSSGPSPYVPSVRRCKTVSDASSTHPRSSHHTTASNIATTSTSVLHQLVLPAHRNKPMASTSEAASHSRDSPVSPSRRGETLRAYSRQRRVFSGSDDRAPTSPEQLNNPLFPTGPASPSIGRVHRPRHSISAVSFSDVAGARSSKDTDATTNVLAPTNACLGLFGDDPSSSMSSTPSLTSPTSTLSRSTSVRSAGSERNALMGGTRYLSLNGSADLGNTMQNLSEDCTVSTWTRRARRWSNSVSRRMSISALNHTLASTTSPYLKAGLQELRSIFDVDTLGVAVDDDDELADLEGASPLKPHKRHFDGHESSLPSGDADAASAAALFSRNQAVFESPDSMSPPLSRQSSSRDRELPTQAASSRPNMNFTSQAYEPPVTNRRVHSWRKHRSLSISNLPDPSLLAPAANIRPGCNAHADSSRSSPHYSTRSMSARSQSMRTSLVAVALAALSVMIVCICALETSMHPDAASVPLTAFMLAQSVFGLAGVLGLAMQRRWVIDLASRLLRAHVLCQILIALAALRSLSRTAFYHDRLERHGFGGTAAAGVLTSPRFLAATDKMVDPHMSKVGSLRDQLTYVCVFVVQAALPLALVLWAQYSIASALSLATRSLPPSRSSSQHHGQQSSKDAQLAEKSCMPTVKVGDADATGDGDGGQRMRFNSENPSISKGSHTAIRSEGWLGFVITRLDVKDTAVTAAPKFELDATELSTRLEHLARVATPIQAGA